MTNLVITGTMTWTLRSKFLFCAQAHTALDHRQTDNITKIQTTVAGEEKASIVLLML